MDGFIHGWQLLVQPYVEMATKSDHKNVMTAIQMTMMVALQHVR